eukprot:6364789-Amphidinium_carterae.1
MATALNLLSGHRADGCRHTTHPDHTYVQEHFMNKAVAFAVDYGRCERKDWEVEMKSTAVAYTGE